MRYSGDTLFTIVLSGLKLTNSNDGQGRGWHRSAAARKAAGEALRRSVVLVDSEPGSEEAMAVPFDESLANIVLSQPVVLIVTRVLGKGQRLWDSDSILRGSAKQVIDAIVASGLLPDDGPKHVALAVGLQDDTRRGEGPSIEVSFVAVENLTDFSIEN